MGTGEVEFKLLLLAPAALSIGINLIHRRPGAAHPLGCWLCATAPNHWNKPINPSGGRLLTDLGSYILPVSHCKLGMGRQALLRIS